MLNPPCCGAEPPAQELGVGEVVDVVAPLVVKFKKLQDEVTWGKTIALHGSSLLGVGVAAPTIQI